MPKYPYDRQWPQLFWPPRLCWPPYAPFQAFGALPSPPPGLPLWVHTPSPHPPPPPAVASRVLSDASWTALDESDVADNPR